MMTTKHITALSILICTALSVGATRTTETPDTLLINERPSITTITESASGLKVTVKDKANPDEPEQVFIQNYDSDATVSSNQSSTSWTRLSVGDGVIGIKNGKHWDFISGGFCLGLVDASGQPDGLGLQWKKSFEISWLNALAVRFSTRWQSVSLGIGFDWRNYKTTLPDHRLCLNGTEGIDVTSYPEGAVPGASRIKVFSLGLPLLYTQRIPGTALSLTVGGILNFNTHASLKTWYKNPEGNNMEEYTAHFRQRRISVDLFGSLNFWKGCGLYVRYSPQSVLQAGNLSPQFKPLSVGVMLFL